MEMIALIWMCFDMGIYTHGEAISILSNPEIHQLIPVDEVPVPTLCTDLKLLILKE